MKKQLKYNIQFIGKVLLVMVFLLSSAISFSSLTRQNTASHSTAQAGVLDGQDRCYSPKSDKSSDSDDKDDDDGDDKSSDGDADSSSEELNDTQKKYVKKSYKILHDDYGVSAEMVAGMLGNWKQESGINPNSVEGINGRQPSKEEKKKAEKRHQDYHTGLGLGQWSYERNDALVDYAKDKGKDWWDFETQIKFLAEGDPAAGIFKSLVKDSGKDPAKNATEFHEKWEVSADNDQTIQKRAKNSKKVWEYMKDKDMTGGSDDKKINKIGKGKEGASAGDDSDDDSDGASASSSDGDTEKKHDPCSNGDDDDKGGDSGTGKTSGEIGDSTKTNGKKAEDKKNWLLKDLPDKYKKDIKLPDFDKKILDRDDNIFKKSNSSGQGDDTGQCTELTWGYMTQMYTGDQPTNGDGRVIYKAYKENGAKITDKPTVGYGWSSDGGYANGSPQFGHTGIVAAVYDDGKWLGIQYNVPPASAHGKNHREPVVSLYDGADGSDNLKFFSGVGKPKDKYKKKKK